MKLLAHVPDDHYFDTIEGLGSGQVYKSSDKVVKDWLLSLGTRRLIGNENGIDCVAPF
jgi:hypothetical protein